MKVSFSDIENAFEFVSSADPDTNYAVLNLETGVIYYKSDMTDEEDFPDEVEESEDYVWIPHKCDFDLGKDLVFRFVEQSVPEHFKTIAGYFKHKGAYTHFKSLLQSIGKLEAWRRFEEDQTRQALKEWCEENEIEIDS